MQFLDCITTPISEISAPNLKDIVDPVMCVHPIFPVTEEWTADFFEPLFRPLYYLIPKQKFSFQLKKHVDI